MNRTASPRVLVVDNDDKICHYLTLVLTKRNYQVETVSGNGAGLINNAVAMAKRFRPHVAIVDLRLIDDYIDELSGLELLPLLESARCILYSAHLGTAVIRKAAREYKAFGWVDKFDMEALFNTVKEAAEEASAGSRQAGGLPQPLMVAVWLRPRPRPAVVLPVPACGRSLRRSVLAVLFACRPSASSDPWWGQGRSGVGLRRGRP